MSNREIHQSQISLFLKCGLAWQYRYIDKLVSAPRAALTVGSAVDAAVSFNLAEKVKTGVDLPITQVVDTFSADFEGRKAETEWGEDDPGHQKDSGIALVRAHHLNIAPKIQPETVQEKFVIETDAGYNLGGTIDIIEKSGIVADTKTSSKKYSEDAIARAFQPAIYDFAYEVLRGKPSTGFRYDVLIKPTAKKPAEIQQVSGIVTPEDRSWFFYAAEQAVKAMDAGIALPAADVPGCWWCSPDWCGYARTCPKFKGRK